MNLKPGPLGSLILELCPDIYGILDEFETWPGG